MLMACNESGIEQPLSPADRFNPSKASIRVGEFSALEHEMQDSELRDKFKTRRGHGRLYALPSPPGPGRRRAASVRRRRWTGLDVAGPARATGGSRNLANREAAIAGLGRAGRYVTDQKLVQEGSGETRALHGPARRAVQGY